MSCVCVSCNSVDIKSICFDGEFTLEGNKYPLVSEYTLCNKCGCIFIQPSQVLKNREYLDSVKCMSASVVQ